MQSLPNPPSQLPQVQPSWTNLYNTFLPKIYSPLVQSIQPNLYQHQVSGVGIKYSFVKSNITIACSSTMCNTAASLVFWSSSRSLLWLDIVQLLHHPKYHTHGCTDPGLERQAVCPKPGPIIWSPRIFSLRSTLGFCLLLETCTTSDLWHDLPPISIALYYDNRCLVAAFCQIFPEDTKLDNLCTTSQESSATAPTDMLLHLHFSYLRI